jgi:predicted nucleic acid-binding protein
VKVVLDTNVLLAAFAARGLCEAVFEACPASHEIILSDHILGELQRHLRGSSRRLPGRSMPSSPFCETAPRWLRQPD